MRKQREDMIGQKRAEEELNRMLQQEMTGIRAAIQKVRVATPENFEELRKQVDDMLQDELPKLLPEAANLLFEEYQTHIEFAEQRVETLKEQKRQNEIRLVEKERLRKEHADNNTSQEVEVPASALPQLLGRNGSTLPRLIAATGCSIEVPQVWQANGTQVSVRLKGGTKQRRLALEALHIIVDGGGIDDVSAAGKGALVVPHGLNNRGREKWLAWRLRSLEHQHKLKAAISGSSIRITPKEGAASLAEGSERRHIVGAALEAAVQEAQALVELDVNAKMDKEPTDEKMTALLSPWVEQYGILVKGLQAEEDVVPVGLLGPPSAARDAAAMLWAAFNQGKATAAVLQVSGRVQQATELQAKDFENDIRSLEEEMEVEVTQTETALWVAGTSQEMVEEARNTIREMMQFYFAEDFFLLEGLNTAGMDKLKQDPELQAHRSVDGCVVSLHSSEGAAWLCGPARGPAQRRIQALVKPA